MKGLFNTLEFWIVFFGLFFLIYGTYKWKFYKSNSYWIGVLGFSSIHFIEYSKLSMTFFISMMIIIFLDLNKKIEDLKK